MYAKTALASLAVAVFTFVITATPASATPPEDACALLTAAQVGSVVGVPFGAGTHVTPTYVKTCTWTATTAAANGSKYTVTVSYQAAQGFAGAKQMMQQMEAETAAKHSGQVANSSASGIGDDAFYSSMGGRYTALLVKKGNVSFKVAIYGELAMDKAKDMEKSLALQALSKL